MKKISIIALMLAFNAAFAIDPMYNYRYTLGPEILVPDAFHASTGFWTHYNEDGTLIFNTQLGVMDIFEVGMKYMGGTDEKWLLEKNRNRDINHVIDVGAKFAINPNLSLQVDVPLSINRDRDWGGVVSLSSGDGYTKNIFFVYEGRVAFGGASGPGNHAKTSWAFVPYFSIGDAFRLSVCTISSFSFENFKNDFMIDMLPRVEAGFTMFRLMGEVSIGIVAYDAKKYNRYALYLLFDV